MCNRLILILLLIGCGKGEQTGMPVKDRPKGEAPSKFNDANSTTGMPVKELVLEEKIIGTYDQEDGENIFRAVFQKGGIAIYTNDNNETREYIWKIREGEVHIEYEDFVGIYRIGSNGDLYATMAVYENGFRKHIPKEEQKFMKKLSQPSDK